MSWDELEEWCIKSGESRHTGQQLFEWMYRHGISSFENMSNVKKTFRDYLTENCILQTLEVEKSIPSPLPAGSTRSQTSANCPDPPDCFL